MPTANVVKEETEATEQAPAAVVDTVFTRKLAVMGRCKAISRDASYVVQGKKVEYVSITHLCDSLRAFCVAEGLDVTASIADGTVTITLTNAEKPTEQIISTWPVVPSDKGWSYSVKYPLLRIFLVGDGEEAEQSGADNSADAADKQTQKPRHAPTTTSRVELLAGLMAMEGGPRMTIMKSFGYRGSPLNQWVAQLDPDVVDRLADAIAEPVAQ